MSEPPALDFEIQFYEQLCRRLPKDVRVLSLLAQLYTLNRQYDAGLKLDRKLVRLCPEDPTVHYNLACSLALKQRYADALKVLKVAVALGYRSIDWMLQDADLQGLHSKQKFRDWLVQLRNELGLPAVS
jgi:tetratricopeptide (TPR) repeat protein